MIVIGLDVSKNRLDAAVKRPGTHKWYDRKVAHSKAGVHELVERLCDKLDATPDQLRVVMETTGPYHEKAAHWLYDLGCTPCIANPKRVRDFAKAMGLLNKTDRADARALCLFGAQTRLPAWTPPPPEVATLRALINRLSVLENELGRETNRREKAQAGRMAAPVLESIDRCIASLNEEIRRIKDQIDDHFDQHPDLKRDKALLASIPGIGQTSARHLLCLLADRDFTSARQAAAFAGLAVVHFESGSSVRGKPHLSKQGSSKLRAVLYMAAVASLRHNRALKMFYERLRQRGKPALSALGAVMRKLVHIAFGVFKHKTPYDPAIASQIA